MEDFKQYNANSTEHALAKGLPPCGKAAIVPSAALLMLTLSLGIVGCSKSKTNQPAEISQNPSAQSVATNVASAAVPSHESISTNQSQAATKKSSVRGPVRKLPSTRRYEDGVNGVSFVYPRKSTLKVGEKAELDPVAQRLLPMNFVQPGGVTLVVLELPESTPMETQSSYFVLSANKQLSAEQCGRFAEQRESEQASVGDSGSEQSVTPVLHKQTLGDVDYSEFEKQTGYAAIKYFHRFVPVTSEKVSSGSGVCYEFGLATKAIEHNQNSDTTALTTPAERKNVFAKLEKILASVSIKPMANEEVIQTAKTDSKIGENPR